MQETQDLLVYASTKTSESTVHDRLLWPQCHRHRSNKVHDLQVNSCLRDRFIFTSELHVVNFIQLEERHSWNYPLQPISLPERVAFSQSASCGALIGADVASAERTSVLMPVKEFCGIVVHPSGLLTPSRSCSVRPANAMLPLERWRAGLREALRMLLGFNLLLWTTHVTDEHFPLFARAQARRLRRRRAAALRGRAGALRAGRPRARATRACAAPASPSCPTRRTARSAPTRPAARGRGRAPPLGGRLPRGRRRRGPVRAVPPAARRVLRRAADRGGARRLVEVHRQAARLRGRSRASSSRSSRSTASSATSSTPSRDAAELVRRVDRPNYGLLYDTFHANIEEKDPVGVIAPQPRRRSTTSTSPRTTAARRARATSRWRRRCRAFKAGRLRRLVRDRGVRPGAAGAGRGDPGLARLLPRRARRSTASATTSCARPGPRPERD